MSHNRKDKRMTELPTTWRKVQYASWGVWAVGWVLLLADHAVAGTVVFIVAGVGFVAALLVQNREYRRHDEKLEAAFLRSIGRAS